MQKLSHILPISIKNPILIYRKGQTTPAVYTSRTKKPDISNGRKQSGMPFLIFARHSSRQSTETVLTHNNIHYKKEHAMNHRNTRLLLSLAVLSALAACGRQESKEQKPASAPTGASAVQTTLDSDFKCNTRVPVVGTDSRIKHLAFRSQVFFLAGGSTHLEPCVSPDR